ncbi:MAG: alpha-L-arabinofuranosidase C-terminal domain-containing protein [Leeuwenhoekiella sp.]
MIKIKLQILIVMCCFSFLRLSAQQNGKPISPDLFGIFFEDISYAADGGLYAELVQNRSFEYSPSDIDNWKDETGWNAYTAWEFETTGYGYGTMDIKTDSPINPSNPHYITLHVEDMGQEGVGLVNHGYDGIPVKKGETYNFSIFIRTLSKQSLPVEVSLRNENGDHLATATFTADADGWKKYSAKLVANAGFDKASLAVIVKANGELDLDMVSLFPESTFKNRPNGMRADLAQVIADLKPKFMRFPGGCLVHGDGLDNMYRWENTVGPIEQRTEQRNIWNYHQTMGLGYYEYFQFCEDIGAKPVPIVPAAVSCQNSGGTWRIGSNGQKCLPIEDMGAYIQEVLNLIEYANGPATSKWGKVRADAGHPKPFNLEYLGIGNEDKITSGFKERFTMIYKAVKKRHPEITLIGTVGPGPEGDDYEKGWSLANQLQVSVVDEHYYEEPQWFLDNLRRYDTYNRNDSEIYIGEYAAHEKDRKNTLRAALAEAAYMTSLEKNGDIVKMSSYAPLLAKEGHINWSPDLIYFTNTTILKTANYYVQKMFSTNSGDFYYPNIIDMENENNRKIASSCVKDSATGAIILKLVNMESSIVNAKIDLSVFTKLEKTAECMVISGDLMAENTFESPNTITPKGSTVVIDKNFEYSCLPNSLTIIRIEKEN